MTFLVQKKILVPKVELADKRDLSKDVFAGSDFQLWQEFQLGNENAYATIYRNNVASLYNYGLQINSSKPLIKDCIQDLFVEIWNNKENLSQVKFIKSYLFTALRRKIISESKTKRKIENLTEKNALNGTVSDSFERRLIEKQNFDEQTNKLNGALLKLTQRQREAIYLKFNAQLTYEEITHTMGLTTKGAYKLMDRALKVLRKHM